jgi:hypothetical protein
MKMMPNMRISGEDLDEFLAGDMEDAPHDLDLLQLLLEGGERPQGDHHGDGEQHQRRPRTSFQVCALSMMPRETWMKNRAGTA